MQSAALERLLCLLDLRLHAIAACEVDDGWRLQLPPMDVVLVHYVLKGSGVLCSDDGTCVEFAAGSVVVLPPGPGHFIATSPDEPQEARWTEVGQPADDGMMRFLASDQAADIVTACATVSVDCGGLDVFGHLREPLVEHASAEPALRVAFELMLGELRSPRFGTRALAEALMKQCFVLALRGQIERGETSLLPLGALHDKRLLRALLDMLQRPAEPHSVDELAKATGMSRSLFAERFAQAFDRPPMDLLRQIRLHRAANLLRATRLPVSVIAFTVGYASRSYFSRAFRSAYGTDPQAFRQQARLRPGGAAPLGVGQKIREVTGA